MSGCTSGTAWRRRVAASCSEAAAALARCAQNSSLTPFSKVEKSEEVQRRTGWQRSSRRGRGGGGVKTG